jgi:hypothetical protein
MTVTSAGGAGTTARCASGRLAHQSFHRLEVGQVAE